MANIFDVKCYVDTWGNWVDGVLVYLDDDPTPVGVTPFAFSAPDGNHSLRFEKEGYNTYEYSGYTWRSPSGGRIEVPLTAYTPPQNNNWKYALGGLFLILLLFKRKNKQ